MTPERYQQIEQLYQTALERPPGERAKACAGDEALRQEVELLLASYEQAETMNAVINEPHRPVSEINEEVPPSLSAVIDRALAKEPSDRYQSMQDLLGELRQVVAQSESVRHLLSPADVPDGVIVPYVSPRRRTLLGQWRRWIQGRRRRWALDVITSVIVAAVGVGIYLVRGRGEIIDSLAVLPLENLSGASAQDYLADGMTEALITDLGKIGALRVISRTSVMQYKGARKPLPQIARELKVEAVVEGSVLRSGDRVRITAQLIEAATDRHLWSESYERDLRDVLSLQQAIERDPNYALAYAGLADYYISRGTFAGGVLPPSEAMPKARAAVMKALAIDETLAEAHTSLAWVKMDYDWDWAGAEREYQRAIELNPSHWQAHFWYGFYLAAMGRFDEAVAEMKRAQELDPLSLVINTHIGLALYWARQCPSSLRSLCRFQSAALVVSNLIFAIVFYLHFKWI
ncbi:MAG: tetratricopeptide repeat protein [Acidobacteria bacterium]|nr:tetratricopeptide repeat protein [Acidobacteriota bacterium]